MLTNPNAKSGATQDPCHEVLPPQVLLERNEVRGIGRTRLSILGNPEI